MTGEVMARTPLAAWRDRFAAAPDGLVVRELPLPAMVSLRAHADAVGAVEETLGVALPGPVTATRDGELRVLWLGPDEWLVLAPAGTADSWTARLGDAAGDDGAAIDVSAQRTVLALSGPLVPDVLASGCALDLDPAVRPPGHCASTLFARVGVVLVVEDDGVLLLVRSSFADHVARWVLDAATTG